MFINFYKTTAGTIGIAEKDGKITNLYFETDTIPVDAIKQETPVLKTASLQLTAYLSGELKDFSLPLDPIGSPFMKSVWAKLCDIPFGKTASYKDIAVSIGSPKAARAVGLANNRNPIPIFIPCHRVIGANGALTGYRGGLDLKKMLLDIERYR